eukprot:1062609-Prorocentrum_minimum.AAC.1
MFHAVTFVDSDAADALGLVPDALPLEYATLGYVYTLTHGGMPSVWWSHLNPTNDTSVANELPH